ncbi:unnamed protein product [Oreochromis niloticus]|nr:unnamed protein product [Mustela putorius furo]
MSCAAEKQFTSMYAMEEIHDNQTPLTNHTGQRNSKDRFYLVVIFSLVLLVGVLTAVFFCDSSLVLTEIDKYHFVSGSDSHEHLSAMTRQLSSVTEEINLLNAKISDVSNQISSMTEERDLLHTKLTEKSEELERLQSLFKQNKTCPVGWRSFSDSCYLLSESSGSWDAARKDCRDRGADLVVIECTEEQTFLSNVTTKETWIGLNDKEQEGTWKWVDGTPLTLTYWGISQPNSGGEQDCVYVRKDQRRRDCRDRGADLVVINSPEEQV